MESNAPTHDQHGVSQAQGSHCSQWLRLVCNTGQTSLCCLTCPRLPKSLFNPLVDLVLPDNPCLPCLGCAFKLNAPKHDQHDVSEAQGSHCSQRLPCLQYWTDQPVLLDMSCSPKVILHPPIDLVLPDNPCLRCQGWPSTPNGSPGPPG